LLAVRRQSLFWRRPIVATLCIPLFARKIATTRIRGRVLAIPVSSAFGPSRCVYTHKADRIHLSPSVCNEALDWKRYFLTGEWNEMRGKRALQMGVRLRAVKNGPSVDVQRGRLGAARKKPRQDAARGAAAGPKLDDGVM